MMSADVLLPTSISVYIFIDLHIHEDFTKSEPRMKVEILGPAARIGAF